MMTTFNKEKHLFQIWTTDFVNSTQLKLFADVTYKNVNNEIGMCKFLQNYLFRIEIMDVAAEVNTQIIEL